MPLRCGASDSAIRTRYGHGLQLFALPRIGGPWVYYEFGTVKIDGHPEMTSEYIWGDKTLRTVRCTSCGCVTHWEPLSPTPGAKHGVNLSNFNPSLLASVRVRRFDGADTWKFID